MARLIDADELLRRENKAYMVSRNHPSAVALCTIIHTTLQKLLSTAPTVDAVEVVRCKDCHNRTKRRWCNLLMMDVEDEGFCSYGKRKENGSWFGNKGKF